MSRNLSHKDPATSVLPARLSVCLSVCLTTKTLQMYNVSHDLDLQSLHDEMYTCVVHLATCMLQTASSPQQTPVEIPIFALPFLPGQILRHTSWADVRGV